MIAKVKEFIKELNMLKDVKLVVAGVSGGADSVCLLSLLRELQREAAATPDSWELLAVHVNHGIRGETALRDQHFVEALCREWEVECRVVSGNVPELAQREKMTEEEAGREFRYRCFARIAAERPHSVVAVAHHGEDQAETVLFRMMRGTGVDGLCGMRPVSWQQGCQVIRPLLCLHRWEVEQYLEEHQMSYCTDETNDDRKYSRNVIRQELLPVMERLNDRAVDHINQLAEQAGALMDYVKGQAQDWVCQNVEPERDCLNRESGFFKVNVKKMRQQPAVLQRQILREMISKTGKGQKDIGQIHLQLLEQLLSEEASGNGRVQLPNGLEAFLCYSNLLIGENKMETNCENLVKYFSFREISGYKGAEMPKKNYTKIIDCDRIRDTLVVRYRRPGDFIVVDREGHKKPLKKYFIDEKIPKHMREHIPIVCDGNQVVWIVGERLSPEYYVTEQTKSVVEMVFHADRQE